MPLTLFCTLLLLAALRGVVALEPCGELATSFVPLNSSTKAEVSWQALPAKPGFIAVRLRRFVAYSAQLKYVSFALTQQGQMGPADLVIDCYEDSTDVVLVTTGKNDASHRNIPDAKMSSRVSNVASSRIQTELLCTFVMPMPNSTSSYVVLAAGSMAFGAKKQHSERFVSDRLTIQCEQPKTTATAGRTQPPERKETTQTSSGGWNVSTSAPDDAKPQRLAGKSSGLAQVRQPTLPLTALLCSTAFLLVFLS